MKYKCTNLQILDKDKGKWNLSFKFKTQKIEKPIFRTDEATNFSAITC